jgi:hypothetical protein
VVRRVVLLLRQAACNATHGVVACAVALHPRPVQDDAYALPNAPGGLGKSEPDRGQDLQDLRRINVVDAPAADYGKGVRL